MSKSCKLIILCEDKQHKTLIYRLLKDLGFNTHRIRSKVSPLADGAADQFVRERYADEVALHRQVATRMNAGLVVMIDADENNVNDRYQELRQQLDDREMDHRSRDEHICILVPKREVETWIYALEGRDVNENTKYPKLDREGDCADAVQYLADMVKTQCADDLLPSLYRGCRELTERLPD